MSRLWRNNICVSLSREGIASLPGLRRGAKVTVVLSSHHARYSLLPWNANIASESEWQAYAQHRFSDTYGMPAGDLDIRVSPAPKGAARVASAVKLELLAELRTAVAKAGGKLVSVQPGLMRAFNAHRREFRRASGWLVAVEEGRMTLALIAQGLWELVRVRNVGAGWRDGLHAMLRREEMLARREKPVERVVVMENMLALG